MDKHFEHVQNFLEDAAFFQQEYLHFTGQFLSGLATEFHTHPQTLSTLHLAYWQNLLMSMMDFQANLAKNLYAGASLAPLYIDLLTSLHQHFSQYAEALLNLVDSNHHSLARTMKFMLRQWIDALAPRNFLMSNPEVLLSTLKTQGENLLQGGRQFWEDLIAGRGLKLATQLTDMQAFQLGKNLAITQGSVIYQNELMELIEYTPTQAKIYPEPILIFPPWINKYYILDLRPENSLVKYLLDQGYAVFMVSWVNPSKKHRETDFQDYLIQGGLPALDILQKIFPKRRIHTLGYCIGGTLLACLLSYLKAQKKTIIASATFLTTLLDFSEPGDLGIFMDEFQIQLLKKRMQSKGYLDGNWMATIFSLLRPKDLIWPSFVNQYLKGEKPRAFDLLYWNADPTNLPEKAQLFYMQEMYLHNRLTKANALSMNGIPLDLSKIDLPCYYLAAENDHIAPWKSCYQSAACLGSVPRFVLSEAGHVAGVVNPPQKKKYGYYTCDHFPDLATDFQTQATYHAESWWIDWITWLKTQTQKKKIFPLQNRTLFPKIRPAPGNYVKKRVLEI